MKSTRTLYISLNITQFTADAVNNASILREKRVPKQCPWGTIATNGTLFSKGHQKESKYETVPLGHWGTEIVPLRVPYYGQSNSAPRGTISGPLFLSVGILLRQIVPFLQRGTLFIPRGQVQKKWSPSVTSYYSCEPARKKCYILTIGGLIGWIW